MGLFSRRKQEEKTKELKEELPETSNLPSLPKLAGFTGLPPLPRLKNPEEEKISKLEKDNEESLPDFSKKIGISRNFDFENEQMSPSIINPPQITPMVRETEPIFIKLDKFRGAVENFRTIKEKVEDIESMLKRINEIRMKEDVELKEWENEIKVIKARISSIDNSLFKKAD